MLKNAEFRFFLSWLGGYMKKSDNVNLLDII